MKFGQITEVHSDDLIGFFRKIEKKFNRLKKHEEKALIQKLKAITQDTGKLDNELTLSSSASVI